MRLKSPPTRNLKIKQKLRQTPVFGERISKNTSRF